MDPFGRTGRDGAQTLVATAQQQRAERQRQRQTERAGRLVARFVARHTRRRIAQRQLLCEFDRLVATTVASQIGSVRSLRRENLARLLLGLGPVSKKVRRPEARAAGLRLAQGLAYVLEGGDWVWTARSDPGYFAFTARRLADWVLTCLAIDQTGQDVDVNTQPAALSGDPTEGDLKEAARRAARVWVWATFLRRMRRVAEWPIEVLRESAPQNTATATATATATTTTTTTTTTTDGSSEGEKAKGIEKEIDALQAALLRRTSFLPSLAAQSSLPRVLFHFIQSPTRTASRVPLQLWWRSIFSILHDTLPLSVDVQSPSLSATCFPGDDFAAHTLMALLATPGLYLVGPAPLSEISTRPAFLNHVLGSLGILTSNLKSHFQSQPQRQMQKGDPYVDLTAWMKGVPLQIEIYPSPIPLSLKALLTSSTIQMPIIVWAAANCGSWAEMCQANPNCLPLYGARLLDCALVLISLMHNILESCQPDLTLMGLLFSSIWRGIERRLGLSSLISKSHSESHSESQSKPQSPTPKSRLTSIFSVFGRKDPSESSIGTGKQSVVSFSSETVIACRMAVSVINTHTLVKRSLLNHLAFSTKLLSEFAQVFVALFPDSNNIATPHLAELLQTSIASPLTLFCYAYSHLLIILDADEFYNRQIPFSLDTTRIIVSLVQKTAYLAITQHPSVMLLDAPLRDALVAATSSLSRHLYVRDCRQSFCPPQLWSIPNLKMERTPTGQVAVDIHTRAILRTLPHAIDFHDRAALFRQAIDHENKQIVLQYLCTIRRDRILEDSIRQLSSIRSQIKSKLRIQFVDSHGLREAGIDQNGLFKEYIETLVAQIFNPNLGLFCVTSQQQVYPSPLSYIQANHLELFEFCGIVFGKAMREGILLDAPFTPFFLNRILGVHNSIDELVSLDAELDKNLRSLKNYQGDIEDLCLTFAVAQDDLHPDKMIELIPGGRDISVTDENKFMYLRLMADYRLNKQINPQCHAFIKGLHYVLNQDHLKVFLTASELQRLISGDSTEINVDDLRRHARYTNGYSEGDRVVRWFWEVVEEMNTNDRQALLRFVTSCSKPPLLGFRYLEPPFTIQKVATNTGLSFFSFSDTDRLPTASTCFNLLKLPTYARKSTLKEKLLYSIHSRAGFDLS